MSTRFRREYHEFGCSLGEAPKTEYSDYLKASGKLSSESLSNRGRWHWKLLCVMHSHSLALAFTKIPTLTSYCSLTSDFWTAQHQNKARSAWPAMWLIGNGYFRTTHCKLEKCQLTILPGISGMHRSSAAQWWRSGVYTLHGSRKHSWVMLWRPAVLRLTPEECVENELWRYKAEDNLTLDSCEPLLLVIELKLTFRIWLEKHSALLQPTFPVNDCSAQQGI